MASKRKKDNMSSDNESDSSENCPYEIAKDNGTASTSTSHERIDNEQKKRPRKKIKDFYKITTTDKKQDKIGSCKLCGEKGENTVIKMSNGGTSGLIRHLSAKHEKQFRSYFPEKKSTKNDAQGNRTIIHLFNKEDKDNKRVAFNQAKFHDLLVEYLVNKYLPFNFFEDEATKNLFLYMNNHAVLPNRNTMRSLVLTKFKYAQDAVRLIFNDQVNRNQTKISFTMDGWTAISNKSFYGITAHYIDCNWKIQSFVLDFVPAKGRHSGKEIAALFQNTLAEYNINSSKIQGITTDNASSNFTFMDHLDTLLEGFNSENKHFVCFAHILNLSVQDFLKLLKVKDDSSEVENELEEEEYIDSDETETNDSPVTKIRMVAKKIKRSEQLQEKFRNCCETANVKMLMPVIDVCTRWNSTFQMITWSLKMKTPLNILCDNNESLNKYRLTNEEWALNISVTNYLRPFQCLSTLLSGEKYCTLPMVVIGINLLLDKLESWIQELDNKNDRCAVDEQLIFALQSARDKILKHYKKSNWIYCVSLILDPRHKIEAFDKTAWGRDLKDLSVAKFEEIFKEQYYVDPNSTNDNNNGCTDQTAETDEFDLDVNFLFSKETDNGDRSNYWKKELTQYYVLHRVDENIDILNWWSIHERSFPNLSRMAKDFLATMATSVPAERLNSKASLTIRKHRNKLNAESSRSLLCLNSWLKSEPIMSIMHKFINVQKN